MGSPALHGIFSLRGVTKAFSTGQTTREVVSGIDLDIRRGEFLSIVGPSGSGKSTLLNMLAGVEAPTRGRVTYAGQDVRGVSRTIGYLTQHDSLLPWRCVEDNIGLPLEVRSVSKTQRSRAVEAMLGKVGLTSYGRHFPRQLSGGMQKRAMLARTLVYEPDTVLMDEPFGPLDAQLKLVLQAELMRLWAGSGKTIVFVTHDLVEAITLSDRVIVLSAQPTRIQHVEEIAIQRPRDVHEVRFAPTFERHYRSLWEALAPTPPGNGLLS